MQTNTPPIEGTSRRLTDEQVEQVIGNLLRAGVLLAAVVVLTGGILFLCRHGYTHPNYHVFHGVPASLRGIQGILHSAFALKSRGIMQLGILLLIATPVARVALSLVAFALQRDRAYVVLTLVVLSILLYSLFGGGHI